MASDGRGRHRREDFSWDFSPLFERIDQLITRDIEHWIRRNPQFLEEELPGLAGDGGYSPGDNAHPVLRPSHGAVRQEYYGARGQGHYGTVGQGSAGHGDGVTQHAKKIQRVMIPPNQIQMNQATTTRAHLER